MEITKTDYIRLYPKYKRQKSHRINTFDTNQSITQEDNPQKYLFRFRLHTRKNKEY